MTQRNGCGRCSSLLKYALLGLGGMVAAAGCSASGPPGGVAGRPSDGLLQRPDLQRLVDLQVERNGAELITFLTDGDPAVRARAAFALASVQDTAALPELVRLLEDEHPRVRADAAFALGQTADSTLADRMLAAWEQERDQVTARLLLEALGKTGGHTALERLATFEVSRPVRADLALALARFGLRSLHHPAAVGLLAGWLTDPAGELRQASAYYFGRINQTAPWAQEADRVRGALDELALDDAAAMYLVQALGRLEQEQDEPRLMRRLAYATDWRVRVNAVQAMARRSSQAHIRACLMTALDDESEHVALASAQALAGVRELTETERETLAAWIEHNPQRGRAVTALLGAFSSGVGNNRARLEEAAASRYGSVRTAAGQALERLAAASSPAVSATRERVRRTVAWEHLMEAGARPRLRIETDQGHLVIEMDAEQAPLTTQTLLQIAEQAYYDGIPFHRVVSNFVIQGGDISRRGEPGSSGFVIRSEFTRIPFERGVAGMASSGKDTETSQYFITHSMQPHLDGNYTAFGRVVEGMDVVDRILADDPAVRVRVEPGR